MPVFVIFIELCKVLFSRNCIILYYTIRKQKMQDFFMNISSFLYNKNERKEEEIYEVR